MKTDEVQKFPAPAAPGTLPLTVYSILYTVCSTLYTTQYTVYILYTAQFRANLRARQKFYCPCRVGGDIFGGVVANPPLRSPYNAASWSIFEGYLLGHPRILYNAASWSIFEGYLPRSPYNAASWGTYQEPLRATAHAGEL